MQLIITTSGLPILVDDEDYEELIQHSWRTSQVKKNGKFYAYADIEGKTVSMHRRLLGLKNGDPLIGDHINGCTLDNRKQNLRAVSSQQNAWNILSHKKNKSGLRGVCFHKQSGKWQARIYIEGKRVSLGYFLTKEEASEVYSARYNELKQEIFSD